MFTLPKTMQALVVSGHGAAADSLALQEIPLPEPVGREVLVRVAFSPVNPNDLLALRNAYSVKKPVGSVAGFEASGTVVGGRGILGRIMMGRRVACIPSERTGAWAEYLCADPMQCIPLRRAVTLEQGATMLTNPLTAMVMFQTAKREGHRALAQAAAAGALGRMISRLCDRAGIPLVNVVRGPAQVAALRALGATYVLDLQQPDFEARFAEQCHQLQVTLTFDPLAGTFTGQALAAMPRGGRVRVFGSLSGERCQLDSDELVFGHKRAEGFTLYDWSEQSGLLTKLWMAQAVQRRLRDDLATQVRLRSPLTSYRGALSTYVERMSGGKVLFVLSAAAP